MISVMNGNYLVSAYPSENPVIRRMLETEFQYCYLDTNAYNYELNRENEEEVRINQERAAELQAREEAKREQEEMAQR